ncbi:MAG: hypothetical protein HWN80_04030 [Candidatus Lokiarchaeota archaeon]|nr:hypothetical protein [Candidatus Lokiarchaeota archaeon]
MKRSYLVITKIAVIFTLSFIVYFSLTDYLLNKQLYEWYTHELTVMRATSLMLLNIYFFVLAIIIKISIFKKLYLILIIFGIFAWNVSHFDSVLDLNLLSNTNDDFLELILFVSTSIVAPGLLILIAYYIRKFTSKFEGSFFGKYHLHEGLFGIILVGLGIVFFAFRTYLLQFDVFSKEFKVYLAIVMILLYFFIFFGGFFILRDFDDIIHLRFVKKLPSSQKKPKQNVSIYNSLTHENISFFKRSKLYIFPIGLILTGFSFSMVVYSTKFIPKDVLSSGESINLGYLLGFFAGSVIGYDWVRVFKRFYPKQYEEIELKMIELQKSKI